ncbi:MAG TPA: hypothetical protein EYN54_01505 [Methylococcaceae bacterium]|nr:hypothetical protein [Methylococcaceae bacterium]
MTSLFVMPRTDVGSGVKPPDGAKLEFFELDGATNKDTYTTKAATVANSNPVIANAVGLFQAIYITGDYLVTLTDKDDNQIFGLEPIFEFATVTDNAFVRNIDTLSIAIASNDIADGDTLKIKERETDKGGGGDWSVVLASSVVIDGIFFVQCTGIASLALSIRDVKNINQLGGFADGTTDIASLVSAAAAKGNINQLDFPFGVSGYVINTPVTISNLTCVFNGDSQLVGTATLEDLNGIQINNGIYSGYVFSPEIRGKQIEIISGTIRAQLDQDVLSFTSSGTVGTVNQVAHDYSTGDYIYISGASDFKFLGTFQIQTVVDVDNYTVVVDSSGATAATGTIVAKKPGLWEWIKDGDHEPLGVVDTVPVTTDITGIGLTINFLKTYTKVLTMIVVPDEQIAPAHGMSIGASLSLGAMQIRASVDKTISARVLWNGADWQVTPDPDQGKIFTDLITLSGGNLTVPHSFCPGRAVICMPDSGGGTVGQPYLPLMKSPLDDQFIINFTDVIDGSFVTTSTEDTRMSFSVVKNFSGLIYFDGRDRSGEIGMQFGNIWFFGIMQV